MSAGKHASHTRPTSRRRRRWPWVVLGALLLVALAVGGTAFAAYRYDQNRLGTIMPGVRIAGIDVSNLTREQATEELEAKFDTLFAEETVVRAGGKEWVISPAEMGATAPFQAAVDEALALERQYDWTERAWRRWNSRSEDRVYDIPTTMDIELTRAFVAKVSGAVGENPVSGGLRLNGQNLQFVKSQEGRELVADKALEAVRRALREGKESIKLPMKKLKPDISGEETQVLVVDLSENRLYRYMGRKVVDRYQVATGAPGFPTPEGSFEIVEKRKNPTWVNPDPNGWGSTMPAQIPPGPGNPLGTRALNLNAPGIRIHGTSDIGSLGTAASHGCIRMAMPEVEELYELVDVGTAVLIKR